MNYISVLHAVTITFVCSQVFRINGDTSKEQREINAEVKYLSISPKKPEKYLTFIFKYKEYCCMCRVPANH